MLEMICQGKKIHLQLEGGEKLSMLIVGGSRMGKTFFASLLGDALMVRGDSVHLIDLGMKWSEDDKSRLRKRNATTYSVTNGFTVTLSFSSKEELCGCCRFIANALGFRSLRKIESLKNVFGRLSERSGGFFNFHCVLAELRKSVSADDEAAELYSRLEGWVGADDLYFEINENWLSSIEVSSKIWELDGLSDFHAGAMAQMILYWLFCAQRRKDKLKEPSGRVFVIIDEFQDMDCTKNSAIGLLLTEGQKHGLFLILATQFVKDRFSDAVIMQFKQSGFQVYFRLTEEEAREISKQLTYKVRDQSILYERLTNLPRGHCLVKGCHHLEGRQEISEALRLVEIVDVPENVPSKKKRKAIVIRNKERNCLDQAVAQDTDYREKAYIMPED